MGDKINTVFKQVLKKFLKEEINSCHGLIESVEKCQTYSELKNAFEEHGEGIAEYLGVDIDESCDFCDKKDFKIRELEYKLEKLSYTPKTLNDFYMLESFLKNKDKFSVSEFESLME